MKWNNISDFLDSLEDRMEELSEQSDITSATDIQSINMGSFSDDELCKFDSIADEAKALSKSEDEIVEYMTNRLSDLGYSDDEVTKILDYEGI